MRKIFAGILITAVCAWSLGFSGLGGCGSGTGAKGSINPNFPDLSEDPVVPTAAIDPDDTDQVTVVEPGASESEGQGGKIGTIADQDPSRVLCVIIDPAAGDSADLEVCEADRINTETGSVNGLCPEADQPSRCASLNAGSGPDFCQVTGESDYALVIMNLTSQASQVAYQVVDVTGYPGQSCADLSITEDSIQADDL